MRNRIDREAAPARPPHALRVPVFDRREDPASSSEYKPSVPHITLGAWVMTLPSWVFDAEQSVRPHDAQHPRAGDSDPVQDRSRAWTLRWPSPWNGDRARSRSTASSCASDCLGTEPVVVCPRPPRVERRARALPDLTHPLDAETAPRRRGGRRAHRRDLRIAGAAPRPGPARGAARSPSTAPRCDASPRRASPTCRDDPLSRARGQPWPAPAPRRAGRSPRPPSSDSPRSSRSTTALRLALAPAPGTRPGRRPVAGLQSPFGLPPSAPICLYHVPRGTLTPSSVSKKTGGALVRPAGDHGGRPDRLHSGAQS